MRAQQLIALASATASFSLHHKFPTGLRSVAALPLEKILRNQNAYHTPSYHLFQTTKIFIIKTRFNKVWTYYKENCNEIKYSDIQISIEILYYHTSIAVQ